MDRKEQSLEIRIQAIEYMLAHVYNMACRLGGLSDDLINEKERKNAEYLATQTIQGVEAVESDHATAEFAAAVSSLQAFARQLRSS